MSSDTGPKGDPGLVKGDPASGSQNQRVPITNSGTATAIYQAPVRELEDGMRLRAIANVTLTKCEITDYIPTTGATPPAREPASTTTTRLRSRRPSPSSAATRSRT